MDENTRAKADEQLKALYWRIVQIRAKRAEVNLAYEQELQDLHERVDNLVQLLRC